MGLTNNLENLTNSFQQTAKAATITAGQRLLRLLTGFFLGMLLSLIIQEFAQSGTLMLMFFATLFTLILYRLLRSLSIFQIFVFDVICILAVTLLRMYILIAP